MPYKILKKDNYWRIYKLKEGILAKPKFKTRKSAVNQANNWLRYHGELYRYKIK